MRVAFSGCRIQSVAFCKSKPRAFREDRYPRPLKNYLIRYFKGKKVSFSAFPLEWSGHTAFQKRVWKETRRVAYGKTRTYKQVAEALGKPKAARAVGNALNANPFLVLVPCHRVVSKSGLGGFRPGIYVKRALLKLEGSKNVV